MTDCHPFFQCFSVGFLGAKLGMRASWPGAVAGAPASFLFRLFLVFIARNQRYKKLLP